MRKQGLAMSRCFPFRTYQAFTLSTRKHPASNAPVHTCKRRSTLDGLNTIAQKSVISARAFIPSPTIWKPAGVCCQELATTIQMAENKDPRKTRIVEIKCTRDETLFHPKISIPRKPDSRANAKIPSAARALPKTSPTYLE